MLILALFTAFFTGYLLHGDLHTYKGHHLKTISIEHLANGTFAVERVALDWLAEGAYPGLTVCGLGGAAWGEG